MAVILNPSLLSLATAVAAALLSAPLVGASAAAESWPRPRWGAAAGYLPSIDAVVFSGGKVDDQGTITPETLFLDMGTLKDTSKMPVSSVITPWLPLVPDSKESPAAAYAASTVSSNVCTNTGEIDDSFWLIGGAVQNCSQDPALMWRLDADRRNGTIHTSWHQVPSTMDGSAPVRHSHAAAAIPAYGLAGNRDASMIVLGGVDESVKCTHSREKYVNASIDVWKLPAPFNQQCRTSYKHDQRPPKAHLTQKVLRNRLQGIPNHDYAAVRTGGSKEYAPHSDKIVLSEPLVLIGGRDKDGHLSSMHHVPVLDLRTGQWDFWKTVGDVPAPRVGHGAVHLADGKILMYGGYKRDGNSTKSVQEHPTDELYELNTRLDPPHWKRIHYAEPPAFGIKASARAYHSMVMVDDVLVVGFGEQTRSTGFLQKRDTTSHNQTSQVVFLETRNTVMQWRWTEHLSDIVAGRMVNQALGIPVNDDSRFPGGTKNPYNGISVNQGPVTAAGLSQGAAEADLGYDDVYTGYDSGFDPASVAGGEAPLDGEDDEDASAAGAQSKSHSDNNGHGKGSGKDGKSGSGSDGKSGNGSDGKSGSGKDGKSGNGSDGKSGSGKDGKSGGGSDGKSAAGDDGKSAAGADGAGADGAGADGAGADGAGADGAGADGANGAADGKGGSDSGSASNDESSGAHDDKDKSGKGDNNSSTGAIAGGVIGAAALAVGAVVGGLYAYKKRRDSRKIAALRSNGVYMPYDRPDDAERQQAPPVSSLWLNEPHKDTPYSRATPVSSYGAAGAGLAGAGAAGLAAAPAGGRSMADNSRFAVRGPRVEHAAHGSTDSYNTFGSHSHYKPGLAAAGAAAGLAAAGATGAAATSLTRQPTSGTATSDAADDYLSVQPNNRDAARSVESGQSHRSYPYLGTMNRTGSSNYSMESMVDNTTEDSSSLHSEMAEPSFDSKTAVSHDRYAPPYGSSLSNEWRSTSFNFPETQVKSQPMSYPVPSRNRSVNSTQSGHLRVTN